MTSISASNATFGLNALSLYGPPRGVGTSPGQPQLSSICYATSGQEGGGGSGRVPGNRTGAKVLISGLSGYWTKEGWNLDGRVVIEHKNIFIRHDSATQDLISAELDKICGLKRELSDSHNIASGELKEKLASAIQSLSIYEFHFGQSLMHQMGGEDHLLFSKAPSMTYEEIDRVLQIVRQKQQLPAYREWLQMSQRYEDVKRELMKVVQGIKEKHLPLKSEVTDRISLLNDELRRLGTDINAKTTYIERLWAVINGVH